MNLLKDEYIIVEIIPTHPDPLKGDIAQISALKLKGINLVDRFDYRLNNVNNSDVLRMIQYDKDNFKYLDNSKDILKEWDKFSSNYPIIIFEDTYTKDYLNNKNKELIFPYLDMEPSIDFFDKLKEKYKLEDSNYLVDLIYEAIIMESNNKGE